MRDFDAKWICNWQNSIRGQESPKCMYRPIVPAQEMAKHRAKFGWHPLSFSDVGEVMNPRRETRWNMLGCPKLANWSQLLVSWYSPYCEDTWRRYCCLTSFFDYQYMPLLLWYSLTKSCNSAQMAIFCVIFANLYFKRATCSTFQTCILNLQ